MPNNKILLAIGAAVVATIALTLFVVVKPPKDSLKNTDTSVSKVDEYLDGNSSAASNSSNTATPSSQIPQSSDKASQSLQPSANVGQTLNTAPTSKKAAVQAYVKAVADVSKPLDLLNDQASLQSKLQAGTSLQTFQDLKAKADQVHVDIKKIPVPVGLGTIARGYDLVYSEFSNYLSVVIGAFSAQSTAEAQQKIDAGASIYNNFVDDLISLNQDISSY